MENKRSLFVSGFWLFLITLFHYLLSLFSRSVYANLFGTSREMDVFFLVMGVVVWFNGIIAVAIHKGFVPSFIRVREVLGERQARDMFNSVFNLLMIFSLVLVFWGWVFAGSVARLIGAGIEVEFHSLLVDLFRLGILIVLVNLAFGVLNAVLFSIGDFVFPKIIKLLGLGLLMGMVIVFTPFIGIYSIPLGMLADGIFSVLFLFFRVRGKGIKYSFRLGYKDSNVFSFVLVVFPLMVAALFNHAQELVDRFFVSFLSAGLISSLSYAHLMVNLPVTLFSSGVQVLFPWFSGFAVKGDRDGFRRGIEQALSFSLFFAVPAFVGLMVLGRDAIVALFQHGRFDSVSTENTFLAVPYYIGVIVFGIPSGVLSYALYSLRESKVILWIGVWDFFANAVFNYLFMGWLGFRGIALATSVVLFIDFIFLLYVLQRRIGVFDFGNLLVSFFRVLGASVVMALFLHFLSLLWPVFPAGGIEFLNLCSIGFRLLAGIFLYIFWASCFGSREAGFLVGWFRARLSLRFGV